MYRPASNSSLAFRLFAYAFVCFVDSFCVGESNITIFDKSTAEILSSLIVAILEHPQDFDWPGLAVTSVLHCLHLIFNISIHYEYLRLIIYTKKPQPELRF